jgi:hypothetical protein
MVLLQIVYFLKIIHIPRLIVHRNRISNRKSIVVRTNGNNNRDRNRNKKIVVTIYTVTAVSINKI